MREIVTRGGEELVVQRDYDSDDFKAGYRDGKNRTDASAGSRTGEAQVDYNEGYQKGSYEADQAEAGAAQAAKVQRLDTNLENWLKEGNYAEAAVNLNEFSPDDIRERLKHHPEAVASLHEAAVGDHRLGPDSNAATLTAAAPQSSNAAPDESGKKLEEQSSGAAPQESGKKLEEQSSGAEPQDAGKAEEQGSGAASKESGEKPKEPTPTEEDIEDAEALKNAVELALEHSEGGGPLAAVELIVYLTRLAAEPKMKEVDEKLGQYGGTSRPGGAP